MSKIQKETHECLRLSVTIATTHGASLPLTHTLHVDFCNTFRVFRPYTCQKVRTSQSIVGNVGHAGGGGALEHDSHHALLLPAWTQVEGSWGVQTRLGGGFLFQMMFDS